MSFNSKIEWTDHTFNPWEGCAKVSPGCANCYAATRDARWHGGKAIHWGHGAPRRRTSAANWKLPVKWNKKSWLCDGCGHAMSDHDYRSFKPRPCGSCGPSHRARVFCSSLADWLDDAVPIEWLADLLALIQATPHLDWQLLTKRPRNWNARVTAVRHHLNGTPDSNPAFFWLAEWMEGNPPANVWLGTSVENQDMADQRIPQLLAIPAAVRFLSCEPLLGPVDLRTWLGIQRPDAIGWVIAGGESGPDARRMVPEWARVLRDQCAETGTPFFMKQMGGRFKPFPPIPADLMVREFPKGGAA